MPGTPAVEAGLIYLQWLKSASRIGSNMCIDEVRWHRSQHVRLLGGWRET